MSDISTNEIGFSMKEEHGEIALLTEIAAEISRLKIPADTLIYLNMGFQPLRCNAMSNSQHIVFVSRAATQIPPLSKGNCERSIFELVLDRKTRNCSSISMISVFHSINDLPVYMLFATIEGAYQSERLAWHCFLSYEFHELCKRIRPAVPHSFFAIEFSKILTQPSS